MERERLLLAYQVNDEVQQGHFPVNKELALEVAALLAQVCNNFIKKKRLFLEGKNAILLSTVLKCMILCVFFFFKAFLSFNYLFSFVLQVEHGDLDRPGASSPSGSSQAKSQIILLQALERFYPKRYKQDCSSEQLK